MVLIQSNLKYFIIIIIIFAIVYWFQTVDDKKKKYKERTNIYDKIKLPLLVSAIISLIILWNNDIKISNNFCDELNTNTIPTNIGMNIKSQTFFKNFKTSIISKNQDNMDVYTDLPDF
jgi:hypothetical protein